MFISGQSEKKGGERGSDRSGKEKFYEENTGETHGYNLETKMDILAAAGSDAAVFTGKDICSRKRKQRSREAEDSYIYHTAFDAKASLKIRHMKDYGVLDYEETVTVEDSCDYLDGDENLDEIQEKIARDGRKRTDRYHQTFLSDLQDPDRLGTGKDGDFGCEYCEQHTFLLCR